MTISCAICVAVTSILAALIAREKNTVYELRDVPTFDDTRTTDYFPLAVGNRWTYEGVARNLPFTDSAILEKHVRITMEVVDVVRGADAELYVMSGSPADAAWAIESRDRGRKAVYPPRSHYGYLVISNKVFLVDSGNIARVADGLKSDFPVSLVDVGDLEFEFPLFKGQRFGDPGQLTRPDHAYSWYVNDKAGGGNYEKAQMRSAASYQLIFDTAPENIEVWFEPYLGITRWSYSHHGTRAEASVSLTGCKTHLGD